MTIENKSLILDLIEWLESSPRPYAQVMDAWRTSCPRLPVWEDAVDLGFVALRAGGEGRLVEATTQGVEFLRRERPRTNLAPAI